MKVKRAVVIIAVMVLVCLSMTAVGEGYKMSVDREREENELRNWMYSSFSVSEMSTRSANVEDIEETAKKKIMWIFSDGDSDVLFYPTTDDADFITKINQDGLVGEIFSTVFLRVDIHNGTPLVCFSLNFIDGNFPNNIDTAIIKAKETYSFPRDGIAFENGHLFAVGLVMYDIIDDIGYLAYNGGVMEVSITFDDQREIKFQTKKYETQEENPYYWFYQACKASGLVDSDGKIMRSVVEAWGSRMWNEQILMARENSEGDFVAPTIPIYSPYPYYMKIDDTSCYASVSEEGVWFNAFIKNVGEDTVDGFDMICYCYDLYGKLIAVTEDLALQYETFFGDIPSGKLFDTGRVFLTGCGEAKTLMLAIRKVHLKNGKTIEIPNRDLSFTKINISR